MSELFDAKPDQRWTIPETWSWTFASEIAQIIGGGTPSTTDSQNFDGGEIPWITPADLTGYREKKICRGERNITEKGLRESGARLMPAGTVLFSSRAPIGYVAIACNSQSQLRRKFERSMIRERQREGIALAKKAGVYKGRKPSLTRMQIAKIRKRVAAGEMKTGLAAEYAISRQKLY